MNKNRSITAREAASVGLRSSAEAATGVKPLERIPALTSELRDALCCAADSMQKLTQRIEPILTPLPPSASADNCKEPAVCQSQLADILEDFIHRARSLTEQAESLARRSEV